MRRTGCHTSDHPGLGRRELLQVGGLSLVGMGLSHLRQLEAQAVDTGDARFRTAKSVIFIFQSGGPSQHETFDPKPDAPAEIRGEYGVTQTRIAGVQFCEYLPRLAARTDRFSIVRTMHHTADRQFRNAHNSCKYFVHTGTVSLPIGDNNSTIDASRPGRMAWPSIGSMIAWADPPDRHVAFPAMVEIPRVNAMVYPGNSSGILGPNYDRFGVDLAPPCGAEGGSCPNCFRHADPNLDPERLPGGPRAWWDHSTCRDPSFSLPNLGAAEAISIPQLTNRRQLLEQLEQHRRQVTQGPPHPAETAWDARRELAMKFLTASHPGQKSPFDLSAEAEATRDLYGRDEWGQSFLVARRLVEAGVRMVQVNLRGWDTHQNAFRDLKGRLLPALDRSLSALLDDLHDRGLLDETLIVMCGEMGRTPRISPITEGGRNVTGEIFTPGRHHWGDAFPCFFAGGGIQPGRVIGETDAHGGVPETDAWTPEDLAATIFHCLGIGPDREFHDTSGRPYRVYRGQPILPLL